MKKYIITIVLSVVTIIAPSSCGDEYPWATESDCDDCISPKPATSDIIIDLTDPANGVVVKIYKGKYTARLEKTDPYLMDTVKVTPCYFEVPVNEYYSVVAEYTKGGKKYKVVDGSKLKALSIESTCNTDCWIIKGGTMDCRLKF